MMTVEQQDNWRCIQLYLHGVNRISQWKLAARRVLQADAQIPRFTRAVIIADIGATKEWN